MNYLRILSIACLISMCCFSNSQKLNNLKDSNSKNLLNLSNVSSKEKTAANHWCCLDPVKPGDKIQKTRISWRDNSSVVSYAEKYYKRCGILGLKRCERYRTSYRTQYLF